MFITALDELFGTLKEERVLCVPAALAAEIRFLRVSQRV